MFYTPGHHKDHGLPYNPFKAIVSPRPIGWISTISKDGKPNLAPYSFFNAISETPPMVAFSSSPGENGEKDSLINARETGEFIVNIVSKKQMQAMSDTSAALDHGVSEFDFAGLHPTGANLVKAPMVKDAPCHLECQLWDIITLPQANNHLVIGTVIGIHIDDQIITDGKVDVLKFNPIARLGYMDYSSVEDLFPIARP